LRPEKSVCYERVFFQAEKFLSSTLLLEARTLFVYYVFIAKDRNKGQNENIEKLCSSVGREERGRPAPGRCDVGAAILWSFQGK
jgi:hypothetical protein